MSRPCLNPVNMGRHVCYLGVGHKGACQPRSSVREATRQELYLLIQATKGHT